MRENRATAMESHFANQKRERTKRFDTSETRGGGTGVRRGLFVLTRPGKRQPPTLPRGRTALITPRIASEWNGSVCTRQRDDTRGR